MDKKEFTLAQIMSVTTGILLCENFGDVYDILNFMTRDDLYTHALPRASKESSPYLYEQLPFLHEIDLEKEKHTDREWWHAHWQDFVNEMNAKYGERHTLRPMHSEDHEVIDPIEELLRMNPDAKIIAIKQDDDISPTGNIDWKV